MLAELFRPKAGLLELAHPVSIFQLVALQRTFDRCPDLYAQLCQVLVPAPGGRAQAGRGRVMGGTGPDLHPTPQ